MRYNAHITSVTTCHCNNKYVGTISDFTIIATQFGYIHLNFHQEGVEAMKHQKDKLLTDKFEIRFILFYFQKIQKNKY